MKICSFCGRPAECTHHLIFGSDRKKADEDGLTIPLCDRCHNMGPLLDRIHDNPAAEKLSKMLGQTIYEKNKIQEGKTEEEARELFRKRYGRSWNG